MQKSCSEMISILERGRKVTVALLPVKMEVSGAPGWLSHLGV